MKKIPLDLLAVLRKPQSLNQFSPETKNNISSLSKLTNLFLFNQDLTNIKLLEETVTNFISFVTVSSFHFCYIYSIMVLTFKKNKYTYRFNRFTEDSYDIITLHTNRNDNHKILTDNDNFYNNRIYTFPAINNYDTFDDYNKNDYHNSNGIIANNDHAYSISSFQTVKSISAMNHLAAIIIQKSFRGYKIRYALWSYGAILFNSKGMK